MATVRMLNSVVFSLRTTVRAMRDSLREADQVFSARRRIIGSVSANGTSAQTYPRRNRLLGLFGTTCYRRAPWPTRRDAGHNDRNGFLG